MPIRPEEEVRTGVSKPIRDPALEQVPGAVVRQVAPLTEAAEVALSASRWIVVQMRSGQDDARGALLRQFLKVWPSGRAAAPVAPGADAGIEPATIRQNTQHSAVRASAALALPPSTLEPDAAAEIPPVRRV